MTAPLTLAEVQALAGFTEGPWRMSIENGGGVVAGHRHAIVSAYSSPLGWPCTQVEQASRPLVLAAPALHATCLHLFAEVARLTAELAEQGQHVSQPGAVSGRPETPSVEAGDPWRAAGDTSTVTRCGARSDRGGMTCEREPGHNGLHTAGPFAFGEHYPMTHVDEVVFPSTPVAAPATSPTEVGNPREGLVNCPHCGDPLLCIRVSGGWLRLCETRSRMHRLDNQIRADRLAMGAA